MREDKGDEERIRGEFSEVGTDDGVVGRGGMGDVDETEGGEGSVAADELGVEMGVAEGGYGLACVDGIFGTSASGWTL